MASMTSQNKVGNKAGVSVATISNMINGKWTLITDEMWRKVMIKLRIELHWQTAQTANFNYIYRHLVKAKEQSISFGVADKAGAGKSEAYRFFAQSTPNVIYVECMTFWKTKSFARALVSACGLDDAGTTEELIERFIDHVATLDSPMLILDQADKLKDPSLDLYIDFFNSLANCAFVISGTPALEKRYKRGVQSDRTGYHETWSRLGKKWLKLKRATLDDIRAICHANGLQDEEEIHAIYESCEDDMRRVRKDVVKYFLNEKSAA